MYKLYLCRINNNTMKRFSFLLFLAFFCLVQLSAQEAKIKVACVGNSITFGAGIEDRANHSYPSVLGRMLGDGYEVANFGFSSRTLLNKGDYPYMKEIMYQDALNYLPNVVVIKLGTNDSKPQNWKYKEEYPKDMETMVKAFQSLSSKPKIYLCYPATAFSIQWGINDSVIVADVIPLIDKVAKKMGLEVIDLHAPTKELKALFPDDIHPNPQGAAVLAKEVYQVITGHKVGARVLFIGDSITDGNWGGGDKGKKTSAERNFWDQNHIFGSGYMYLCAAHYLGTYPDRNYQFFNRGISGNTLSNLEERWQSDALDMNPDVLSILIGTNDINGMLNNKKKSSFDFVGWEKRYRALLDRSLSKNPNLKLVLCSPFIANTINMSKVTAFELRDSLVRQAVAVVEKIAQDYHATFLNYQQLFDGLFYKYPALPNAYWIWDGIHPTAAGHSKMSELWIEKAADF